MPALRLLQIAAPNFPSSFTKWHYPYREGGKATAAENFCQGIDISNLLSIGYETIHNKLNTALLNINSMDIEL
ncbi:hypothetical protein C7B76_01315 [filamentous cyanobacterium CCP2]|nr:hypothetical protein C7B76_01315 [filamentous cyanobacterium CCP2]